MQNYRYGTEEHTGLKVGIAETVAHAMAESEYSDEVYEKVEMLKVKTQHGSNCIIFKTTPNNNYRPQTKFAKVMFSQVSVCPRRGGLHLEGVSVRDTLDRDTHSYGNERAVRILLECILVLNCVLETNDDYPSSLELNESVI